MVYAQKCVIGSVRTFKFYNSVNIIAIVHVFIVTKSKKNKSITKLNEKYANLAI